MLFESTAKVMAAEFDRARAAVQHHGDRGGNLELLLATFLRDHLPNRYGVIKGEAITKNGQHSHAIDIMIYDKATCPVLYSSGTAVVPIEGVFGIIEVKSSLSKAELEDAAAKIRKFKELAPRELGVIQTREYVTVHRPSRPFGLIFGYQLAGNSLGSLTDNLITFHRQVYNTDYFVNLVAVLGTGNIYMEGMRWDLGERFHLLDTDDTVRFFENLQHDVKHGVDVDKKYGVKYSVDDGPDSFGRFFAYLQVLLSKMKLNTPDVGQYLGTPMPPLIVRES